MTENKEKYNRSPLMDRMIEPYNTEQDCSHHEYFHTLIHLDDSTGFILRHELNSAQVRMPLFLLLFIHCWNRCWIKLCLNSKRTPHCDRLAPQQQLANGMSGCRWMSPWKQELLSFYVTIQVQTLAAVHVCVACLLASSLTLAFCHHLSCTWYVCSWINM